jgi:hypothetical protein
MRSGYPEAFGGDPHIELALRMLVEKWQVRTIVETGTHLGHSTIALARMGPAVVTIEKDAATWLLTKELDKLGNVLRIHGDSAEVLAWFETHVPRFGGRILFSLDAHWGEHSPLMDELAAIGRADLVFLPVIAIHDFFNPFHPEYGFDTWDIGEYRLELIQAALDKIYGAGGWTHWYNDQAAGLKRGIIYIEPR